MQDNKAEHLEISQAHKGNERDWVLTGRPFERNKSQYSPDEIRMLENQYGSWDNVKYALGFQDKELKEWKRKRYKVLEIGPGKGIAFEQLFKKGLDVYALEPSLLADSDHDSADKELSEARQRLKQDKYRGRVQAAKAVDTRYVFPTKEFDVAFAMGPNFQNYSQTKYELISQIAGALNGLSQTNHSYLAFEINTDGSCDINIQEERKSGTQQFRLTQFLDDHGIRYSTTPFFEKTKTELAIHIYRTSENSEDAMLKLAEAIKTDLSKYEA
jgi:hypothetical protein